MPFNNRMRVYSLVITPASHDIIAPDGACVSRLPAAWIAQQVADGFMYSPEDVMGLNMTLNARGIIRHGSRLVLADAT